MEEQKEDVERWWTYFYRQSRLRDGYFFFIYCFYLFNLLQALRHKIKFEAEILKKKKSVILTYTSIYLQNGGKSM